MARHILSALCKRISIDARTKSASLFDLIEGLMLEVDDADIATGAPDIAPVEMYHVIILARSAVDVPEKVRARTVLITPQKTRYVGRNFDVDLKKDYSFQANLEMSGLPIEGSGIYEFTTELREVSGKKEKWKQLAKVPLVIQLLEMTPPRQTRSMPSSRQKKGRKTKSA